MLSRVISVGKSSVHTFSKEAVDSILLIVGEGVEGDAHKGVTVKHRSRVKADPTQPNLRQVHLIHNELIQELQEKGFDVHPAAMGENITTSGVDLLSLPTDTILAIGSDVKLKVTGLRNPCAQLDNYQKGLTAAVLDRDEDGNIVRKAGIMSVVLKGGVVNVGDAIDVMLPAKPHRSLEPV